MLDTLMFILFCFGPAVAAFAAIRQEQNGGGGRRKKDGWKPTPTGGIRAPDDGDAG